MDGAIIGAGWQGFLLGGGLIVAIGAQNAFILKMGLLRHHVFVLTSICFIADAALIVAGVVGLGAIVHAAPVLLTWISFGGAAFLFLYGAQALYRVFKLNRLHASGEPLSLKAAISTILAFTFLNPHVYLDTVVLLGGLAARFSGNAQLAFTVGAITASGMWFYGLGFGARLLQPLFARPQAWRILDGCVCLIMWWIAYGLFRAVVQDWQHLLVWY